MTKATRQMTRDRVSRYSKERRDRERTHLLQRVVKKLEKNDMPRAVQLFLGGQARGLIPKGPALPKWLTRAVGPKATNKLLKAFARHPCYFCRKGRVRCVECDGKGYRETGPCETCLGIGIARCEFCDGTGRVSIDAVPKCLRPIVIRKRAESAMRNLKTLLDRPAPEPSSDGPGGGVEPCAKLLLELNRNLGFLENAVVALGQSQEMRGVPRQENLFKACVRSAIATDKRIRQTLQSMSVSARTQADTTEPDSPQSETALKKAYLYESLHKSKTYAGTSLEHPFLATAVVKVGSNAGTQSASEPVRGKAG